MGLTCGGKEVEMSEEKKREMKDAMEDLQVVQYQLLYSEKNLQQQLQRKRWPDLSAWEKFKMLFGWDPNGRL